jgi:hypothetical protein
MAEFTAPRHSPIRRLFARIVWNAPKTARTQKLDDGRRCLRVIYDSPEECQICFEEGILGEGVTLLVREDETRPNTIIIDGFESNITGQGLATQALDHLCLLADDCGVTLSGQASFYNPSCGEIPDSSYLSTHQLVRWYKRFGFVLTEPQYPNTFPIERQPRSSPNS